MTFDFIIVGAGSAGCVLAYRLTEDPGCKVLLIEAGDDATNPLVEVPGAALHLEDTELDWAFKTVPQRHLHERRIGFPRGRGVGGSSLINYMMYVRGNRGDYDHWHALGNEGWGYDDVLPYFIRAESNAVFQNDYHGQDGPLSVEEQPERDPLNDRFLAAARAMGIAFNPDFNGAKQEGCGYYQVTFRDGRRCSVDKAYLDPARKRKNLTLVKDALVLALRFEKGRVRGIDYLAGGRSLERAFVEQEIICAAGAIGSPHLLMLSGIGPADHLRAHGIDVVLDQPGVGQGFQDHVDCAVRCEMRDPEGFYGALSGGFSDAVEEFERGGRGPLSSNLSLEAGAFLHSANGDAYPAYQLFFVPGASELFRTADRRDGKVYEISGQQCRPRSSGTVRLASANPLVAPLIDPNYFADPADLKAALECLEMMREIMRAEPLSGISTGELEPGNAAKSKEDLAHYIRQTAFTSWHPASSCRMGVGDNFVVDPTLRVDGVEGLRICDASVMPTMVSGNLNAPVIMIAEKGADLIKANQ
jgi:choline dehydrogenase